MTAPLWQSPIKVSQSTLKNRIIFPPITCNWASEEGYVAPKQIKFYQETAEGGCGMIVVEGTAVSQEGKATKNSLCIFDESYLDGLAKLASAVKKNNCFVSLQLAHAGGQANPNFTGENPVSPSGLECKATGFASGGLELQEIVSLRKKFVKSAELAFKSGFDAIELHLAHGYLLHEFLSEHSNKRQDDYGGSFSNRARLILEIIEEIKSKKSGILGVRISGEDYIPDGINPKVNSLLVPILDKKGVDYFSVTAGIYETSKDKHTAMKNGEFFYYSRKIKEFTFKPVIGVGKILSLSQAETHLQNNECDLVAIGRGLIADPFMIRKYLEGKPYNKCKECGECMYLKHGRDNLHCKVRGE